LLLREPVHIIGGGLAGTEAAWQIARRGLRAVLHEMRPARRTPAHQTDRLAELVCSNSLKSEQESSAPWLLKEELRRLGSLLLSAAQKTRVPGGHALTVDRELFAAEVTGAIAAEPLIELRREEVTSLPEDAARARITIIATGPLTSDALAQEIARLTGTGRLFFYDSISPIVEADSVDTSIAFWASRYGKSTDGTDDYLNCPFDRRQYEMFVDELLKGESVSAHIAEDGTPYFEACLPIEELARRGRETLRFGPMKPMGLSDPRTGHRPWAVVQLRQENLRARSFNLVGFQNHLKFGEQARILRLIPGLAKAEFLRFGQIHRNTYINAPALLTPTLQLRAHPDVLFAGQISGVEGYVEAIATGLMAGMHAAVLATGGRPAPFPRESALGSLCHYVSGADPSNYQPANITFDLLPELGETARQELRRDKKARHAEICRRALEALERTLHAGPVSAGPGFAGPGLDGPGLDRPGLDGPGGTAQ
jgi:methylenetetrahydrofolate--tRNA-(uracil-5-)-methyltransferase